MEAALAASSYRRILIITTTILWLSSVCNGQVFAVGGPPKATEMDSCDGIFLTYTLTAREMEYPHVKNISKQAWAFKAEASLMNVGDEELKDWKMYIGFQHREILVSADGAVPIDSEDFPAEVGNGTTLAGNPVTDLKTAIETAGDYTQMAVTVAMSGTQFGLGKGATPMPKTIKLVNDGFKCPAASRKGMYMITHANFMFVDESSFSHIIFASFFFIFPSSC